ncbi:MAG: TIGR04255 family protein [Acidimicrobiales bacterium]|nr:TIGR04255 family protein [Acidimicrobiales bacterium]
MLNDFLNNLRRPEGLPDFDNPPLDEVAITLVFSQMLDFSKEWVADFQKKVINEFPKIEVKNSVVIHMIEDLSTQPNLPVTFNIPMGQNRYWLISEDDATLVQLQHDSFIFNWRRRDKEYPHFEAILPKFWTSLEKYLELVEEKGYANLVLRQVQVEYINWIPEDMLGKTDVLKAGKYLSLNNLGEITLPDDETFLARYSVRNDSGVYARLYLQSQSALRDEPMLKDGRSYGTQTILSFRVPCNRNVEENWLFSTLSEGRNIIVKSFTELTSELGHKIWGKK